MEMKNVPTSTAVTKDKKIRCWYELHTLQIHMEEHSKKPALCLAGSKSSGHFQFSQSDIVKFAHLPRNH